MIWDIGLFWDFEKTENMDCNGDSIESGSGVSNAQSIEDGVLRRDERCCKQVSPPRVGGSRNTSPMGSAGSRNTSPSRQKVIKTKPRGLDEETLATFGKAVHTDIQMEDNIWAMLPEDLLYEILARVPPFMIFRLRSVCKRWYSLLQDSSFLKCHSRAPSHGPCLLTFWKNSQTPQCSVVSLPLKTWYRIPFTFLPQWAFWLVGSSGGLVCFSGLDGLTFKTLVCNPLTQTWRTLPSMHYNQQRQLIMVVDRLDRSFKLIATSDIYGDKSLPTEVYDSKLDSWSVHQIMPAVNLCSSKMAYCDSRLYLETLSPLGLMMYRIDTGHWEHIPAKFPRSLLDGYLVAGTQKRLFLVGRIGLYSTFQSMRIWELDHAKIMWVELSRMPPKYFRALLRLSAERFECFGQDNLICFTSWNQGKGLLFDVDKKLWSWIGGCALQSYNSQVWKGNKTSLRLLVLESSDRTGAVHMWKLGLGGSNLMVQEEPSEEDDALKKSMASLLEQMNDQKEHMTMLEPKASESTNFVIPRIDFYRRNPKCYRLQYSNTEVADGGRLECPSVPARRQMSEEHPQKDETNNLDEDAKEIVNLMHKDYKGMASGRPPINNNEPRN